MTTVIDTSKTTLLKGLLLCLALAICGALISGLRTVNAATSSNTALKWTTQLSAGIGAWQSITWSPEQNKLIAVASQSTFPFATLNRTMTSADGKTWSLVTMPGTRPLLSSVTWSPDLNMFAAVTCGDTIASACQPTTTNSSVVTSPDGLTWTPRTNPDATATWRSVTWASGVGFVAVADSGTNRVMTSTDGVTWTGRTASQANTWRSVVWAPGVGFVAVASSGTNRVMTSPDGITWANQTATEANSWSAVTWSPDLELFVAVSQDGTNRIMTSPNGTTWTPRTAPGTNGWSSIAWSPELSLFVALASSGTDRVMTSQDGITWAGSPASVDNSWTSVVWAPTLEAFVAVSSSGSSATPTSAGSYRTMTGSMIAAGTDSATNVASRTATLNGIYTDKYAGANVFFRYRLEGSGDLFSSTPPQAVTNEGPFTANVSGLLPTTNYEYKAVVQWPSANGTETLEGGVQTFTTGLADDDNDGIFNPIEDAGPNGGDANDDGTLDSLQSYVGSIVSSLTNKYVTLEVDAACQIDTVSMKAESSNAIADQLYDYPVGLMNFTINCSTPGFVTTVTQYYFDVSNGAYTLRKHNPNNNTYFAIAGSSIGQQTIDGEEAIRATFQVTDGAELDMDNSADGMINDPAGLALQLATPPSTTPGGSLAGTGMDMWGYVVFVSLSVITGLGMILRRKLLVQ